MCFILFGSEIGRSSASIWRVTWVRSLLVKLKSGLDCYFRVVGVVGLVLLQVEFAVVLTSVLCGSCLCCLVVAKWCQIGSGDLGFVFVLCWCNMDGNW